MVIGLSAAARMAQCWLDAQKRMHAMEADQIKAELAFLKAQVHPHFLFNTLHNIYTLALTNHPETAGSVFKLAQLMRYFMENPKGLQVPVQDEVRCIQDYIGLQKLRLGANVSFTEEKV